VPLSGKLLVAYNLARERLLKLLNNAQSDCANFWFFGNRCPNPPYLVVILCERGGAIQIEPNAAEEVADIGQAVATAFEHLDFVVQSFDPAAR